MNQADSRTEPSEDDMGDKAPKRAKSVKKVPKAEVRAQNLGRWGRGGLWLQAEHCLSSSPLPTAATGFQDTEDPAQEEDFWWG